MNFPNVQSVRPLFALLVGVTLQLLALSVNAVGTTLVSSNAIWTYLDDGSDPGTAWRGAGFDDSGWSSGAAPLGYGLPGITTTQAAARVTYYHRRTFNVDAAAVYSNLIVRLRRDDGGIVYINDTEVFRSNMPTGFVDSSTLATTSATGMSQLDSFVTLVSPGVLVPGVNLVAVEVHQSGTSSGDAAFDFELTADGDASPPDIVDTNQPSSSVVLQGRNFSLTVAASGAPPLSYQWFVRQGSTVFQPLPGANSDTFSISNMQLIDEGSYYVSISNAFGVVDSPIAIVAFAPDVEPPFIVSLNSVTNNRIGLCFSEPVTLPSAVNPLNYTVDAGFSLVTHVVLRADGKSVELFLGSPIEKFFSVAVTNIEDLVGNPTAAARTGYISQYSSTTVGTLGNPDPAGSVYSCFWDSFEVTVGGDIGGTNDHFQFISRDAVGDFDARVRVTRLDFAGQFSKAGLMVRETFASDSRSLQTYFTPIPGANRVEVAVRATPGGGTGDADFQIGPRAPADPLRWLRITRTNDTFTTYHGDDGVHWAVSGMTTQAFNATLHVGMAVAAQAAIPAPLGIRVASQNAGATTTAGFTDFFVQGAQPGDEIFPTMVASIEGTALRLRWEVTPRDFTVEVSSDFIEWTTVLLPIQEGTGGRSMLIPLEPGQSQLFARLTRVEKVIVASQAKSITQGIILSPGSGLTTSATTGSFCNNAGTCDDPSYPVMTSSVFKSGTYTIPLTSTAAVDTILSGTSVDTVLQVRNTLNLACPKCSDNAPSLGNKSLVMPLPTAISLTARKYTVLVGASQSSAYVSPIQVYITY